MIRFGFVVFFYFAASQLAFAQFITETVFPRMGFSTPELATTGSGRTTSSNTVDLLPPSDLSSFSLEEIWWWERRDRPCNVTATFSDINSANTKFQATAERCNSTSIPKILRLRESFMIRGGAASSLAVCLNNGRVKGIKAELIHASGDFDIQSDNPMRRRQTFVPDTAPIPDSNWSEIRLESPFGFTGNRPGEQLLPMVEEKRNNCRPTDWAEFASCNPENRTIRRMVTGVRLFFNGTTLEGVKPWCSQLRLAPAPLTRPE